MMIFNFSVIEDLVKESNHVQSYENFNDTEDNEQNVKKYYAR